MSLIVSDKLAEAAAEALLADKATGTPGDWIAHYAGRCERPLRIGQNCVDPNASLRYRVRCRRCPDCLRAKRWYWCYAAERQTELSMTQGLRTWFGTLTWSAVERTRIEQSAVRADPSGPQPNWDNPACEQRLAMLRNECLKDVQRYWKRLRKEGHKFRYFLVFEPHPTSGWVHAHWLLHEDEKPIRKRELQAQWPHGFINVSIVGGRSKNAASDPRAAARYVSKYLSKSDQCRQVASSGYRPQGRGGDHPPL